MAQLALSHVTRHFDGPTILDDVTLEIEKGRKIGVIGQNGSGKSTLLKLLAGRIEPTRGEVHRQRGTKLAYLAQELEEDPNSDVLSAMRGLFAADLKRSARLRELELQLETEHEPGRQATLLGEYQRLQDEHQTSGGYDVDQRIAAVLTGLGLPEHLWTQPIGSFSGGERNIIGLARIVLSDPDVILLDEPSNHLDMDGLEWFIRFVRTSPCTVVMVSHDRHLLDATVQEIWEVRRGSVSRWIGNYTDFCQQKEEAQALQERQFKNQQRLIKRLEFQARRLRDMARAYDDPGQAKRAKAMLRRIEQMDVVERPDTSENRFHARLDGGGRHGQIALVVNDFSFSFDDRVLFERANLEVDFGQRVCLVGPNGSGKSTLFNQILEHGSWENPQLRLGKSVRLGDFRQFHEEALDLDCSLVDWIMQVTGLFHQPATELLHRFLFSRDDLERPIGTLSGGEKSRIQLARLVHDQVNFLMLDEPTNHLDIQASEQLEGMLADFDGTLFVISHDRWFLESLANVVVEIRDRRLEMFRGSFGEWFKRRQDEMKTRGSGALKLHSQADAHQRGPKTKSAHQIEREEKKARQREERKRANLVKRLEADIETAEATVRTLEKKLEDLYADGGDPGPKGQTLAAELSEAKQNVESLYAEWERAAQDN